MTYRVFSLNVWVCYIFASQTLKATSLTKSGLWFNLEYVLDEENGIILDKVTQDRCIIITKARMTQILSRFTDIFQSSADVIITEAFKAAGERFIKETSDEKKTDLSNFLKTSAKRFTDAGLGKIEIVQFSLETGKVTFRIHNNFFAEITHNGATYCNGVAAFVTGMYKGLLHEIPNVKEVKCIGKNDPYCEWHMAP